MPANTFFQFSFQSGHKTESKIAIPQDDTVRIGIVVSNEEDQKMDGTSTPRKLYPQQLTNEIKSIFSVLAHRLANVSVVSLLNVNRRAARTPVASKDHLQKITEKYA